MANASSATHSHMRTRVEMPSSLLSLAESQSGVLTVEQLGQLPIGTVRRLRTEWHRLSRGLWCIRQPDWTTAVSAGLLRGGPTSVVGGSAALHLLGLQQGAPETITVWVPSTATPPMVVRGWTVVFRRGHRQSMGNPRRTTVEDALLDSAVELDADSLVAVVARSFSERRSTPDRLLASLSRRQRLRHRQTVEDLCSVAGRGIESVLEWRYQERVERRHRLPTPERQVGLQAGTRVDGLYREFGLVIELDGRRFHDVSKDMVRDNRHVLLHRVDTLRYGWHAVTTDPCAVAAQVAQALTARGWKGHLRLCPNCPTT